MAGVVFENANVNGTLPPHIVYKIRQNASFTATTKAVRDKYWHPGPGILLDGYYQFGFVWLQVRSVEKKRTAPKEPIFHGLN